MRFEIVKTPLNGLYKLYQKPIEDGRGFLNRIYCSGEFESNGLMPEIVQINHALTKKIGSIRGMHFQYQPYSEVKVVTCIKGKVFDVAIDIRKNSTTFLHWHAEILSEKDKFSYYLPQGFAHGYQTLEKNSELIYYHSKKYVKEAEGSINPLDTLLNIKWPLSINEMSKKDSEVPMLNDSFNGI